MANQLPVEVKIAQRLLDYMTGRSAILQYCNKQYNKDFVANPSNWGEGFGTTVNVPKPPRYLSSEGPAITTGDINDINIGTMPVTINRWRKVPLQLGGWELSFTAREFDVWAEKNLAPVVDPILTDLEVAIFGLQSQIANFVGTPGTGFGTTAATAVDLLGAAREKITLVGDAPSNNCVAFVNPSAARKFTTAVAGGFNPQGEISDTIRRAKIFENANFKVFQASNVSSQITGTLALTGNTILTCSNNTLTASVSSGQTLKPGDKFQMTGTGAVYSVRPMSKVSTGLLQDFTVISSSTATTTLTATFYPPIITTGAFQNVTNGPTLSTTSLTPVSKIAQASATFVHNMAFWKDCLGVVTVPVKAPEGLKSRTVEYDGMSITLSTGSDIKDFVQIWRADIVFGVCLFYPELACVFPN